MRTVRTAYAVLLLSLQLAAWVSVAAGTSLHDEQEAPTRNVSSSPGGIVDDDDVEMGKRLPHNVKTLLKYCKGGKPNKDKNNEDFLNCNQERDVKDDYPHLHCGKSFFCLQQSQRPWFQYCE
eukprot:gb/GECG01009744.1/.p1 GENE.gb/GECG01009744.1/~~gb/GECG01009744.1/.p1  ORF type:complete len:122 (+),score=10.49 gb/GECG01009744.1/:1-366(+)